MTQKELKRIFSKGECLSLDALRLYNDGKLNKKSMHEVEKHLLECNLCSGAVDGLNTKRIAEVNKLSEHIQRRLAVYMNTPPRVSFFQRFGFYIISTALLLGAGGTWLYFSKHKNNPQQISDSTKINSQKQNASFNSNPVTDVVYLSGNENQNTVVENVSGEKKSAEKISSDNSAKMENLPAELPGQTNTNSLTVKPEPVSLVSPVTKDPSSTGPTTKSSDANAPVHIKSVQIYPAVTHNDKSSRKESKDGQLGSPSSSGASFEMDEMPNFPGGTEALRNYIVTNFKPTTVDRSKLTRFATGIMFVVNSKSGAVSSPEISFGISPEVDKELLRVVSTMPNWNPGKKRGEVDIMIGVTFE